MNPARLRKLDSAATPGEWKSHVRRRGVVIEAGPQDDPELMTLVGVLEYPRDTPAEQVKHDVSLICALRNLAPAFADAWEALENPALLILESHPNVDDDGNRRIYEAAQKLRAALSRLREEAE